MGESSEGSEVTLKAAAGKAGKLLEQEVKRIHGAEDRMLHELNKPRGAFDRAQAKEVQDAKNIREIGAILDAKERSVAAKKTSTPLPGQAGAQPGLSRK